jgi:2-keto-4-pentenoate hydratase
LALPIERTESGSSSPVGEPGRPSEPQRSTEIMQSIYEELAQSLAKAWNAGSTITLPPAEAAPRSRADAFAIQNRVAEIVGDRCVGWKVGAAVPAARVKEGHDGPIVGRLLARRQHTSPAGLPAAMFAGYKIECEFAFRFKKTVPARARPYARTDLEADLVLHCGLEVAGHRYAAQPRDRKATTHDLIADSGACGAYVEGDGIEDWRQIDFASVPIDARIDDGPRIESFSGEFFRDPVDILVEMVNGLSARGLDVKAGDLLTTGSLTLPTPMRAGQTYVAHFGALATLRLAFL